MSFLCQNRQARPLNRREMLRTSSAGFGALALQGLMAQEARSASALSPRPAPSPAKAKRVIFIFMHGGPSQVDLFDHKPQLTKDDNKPLPFEKPRIVSAKTGNLLASPWKFSHHGQSGAEVSEILPHLSSIVDDLCIVKSIYGSNSRHGGALLELHTGSDTFTRPAMGSWVNYGLGTENQNLPGFITIDPSGSHGGSNAWSSAFLPAHYQGTRIGGKGRGMTVPFIASPLKNRNLQRRELDLLKAMNGDHLARSAGDAELEARIASYELAFRMQMETPGVQDVSGEPEAVKNLYGLDQNNTKKFGEQCLMARRFSEAGVRFVQVTHRYWDSHGNLRKEHARLAGEMDKPVAGLITDLKQRGLLDETLVLWGGEFGRTPVVQGSNGRDHNPEGFTMWMAGGGVKGGYKYGATDEYGYYAQENKMHVNDLHATLLHAVGLDHTQLTYRYAGRDFRLTDVGGNVATDIFA